MVGGGKKEGDAKKRRKKKMMKTAETSRHFVLLLSGRRIETGLAVLRTTQYFQRSSFLRAILSQAVEGLGREKSKTRSGSRRGYYFKCTGASRRLQVGTPDHGTRVPKGPFNFECRALDFSVSPKKADVRGHVDHITSRHCRGHVSCPVRRLSVIQVSDPHPRRCNIR
jgi:hypothetical protein